MTCYIFLTAPRPGQDLSVIVTAGYPVDLPCGPNTMEALEAKAREAQCVRNNACVASVTRSGCGSKRKRSTGTSAQMSFTINLEGLSDFNLTALIELNIGK